MPLLQVSQTTGIDCFYSHTFTPVCGSRPHACSIYIYVLLSICYLLHKCSISHHSLMNQNATHNYYCIYSMYSHIYVNMDNMSLCTQCMHDDVISGVCDGVYWEHGNVHNGIAHKQITWSFPRGAYTSCTAHIQFIP